MSAVRWGPYLRLASTKTQTGPKGLGAGSSGYGRVEGPIKTGMLSLTDQASERALSGESATRSHELEPLENTRFHHSRMTPLAQSHGWL